MRKFKGQKGLSLVEVTIMLLVLMLLTSVLAPSIFDFVNDAQLVKVKEDCEAIGLSIARLTRDVNACLTNVELTGCTKANHIGLLFSDGIEANDATTALPIDATSAVDTSVAWRAGLFTAATKDSLADQLVTNAPNYKTPVQNVWGNQYYPLPAFATGWRGAYVAPPIGPDPWGHQYMVNAMFLSVAYADAGVSTTIQGNQPAGWAYDTICISAGKNGSMDTPFYDGAGFGTVRGKDDFVYVIAGGTK